MGPLLYHIILYGHRYFRRSRQWKVEWSFGPHGALINDGPDVNNILSYMNVRYVSIYSFLWVTSKSEHLSVLWMFELFACTRNPIGLSGSLWQVADSRIQFGHKIIWTKYGCPRLTKMCARDHSRWPTCILSVKTNRRRPDRSRIEDKTTVSVLVMGSQLPLYLAWTGDWLKSHLVLYFGRWVFNFHAFIQSRKYKVSRSQIIPSIDYIHYMCSP